jgi:hypothetical protein
LIYEINIRATLRQISFNLGDIVWESLAMPFANILPYIQYYAEKYRPMKNPFRSAKKAFFYIERHLNK